MLDTLLLIGGLALILLGANGLTDGSAAVAKRFRISDLVIGLTIVAFGTSAPELVISVLSALNGSAEMAIGNVVGSNTFNALMIIGCTAVGPKLENHPLFPERTNVEFVEILPDQSLRMRVWERGSCITMACGTGACATAVAAVLNHKAGRKSWVRMDGGDLHIHWDEKDGHVYMTGPAGKVFEGEIEM